MIKAALFDLDGTFADTAPDLAASLNFVRGVHGLPPLPLEILRPQASHGSRGLIKVGFDIDTEHADFIPLRDMFLEHYANNICVQTQLFSDMPELIDSLEQRNIKWGIITNKPDWLTKPLMHALGYATRAGCLISGDTCSHAKPHPEPMFKACEIIDVPPAQCLYLGDDIRDMKAANASGMHGIIAKYGYVCSDASAESWKAHGSIDKPTELIGYLDL